MKKFTIDRKSWYRGRGGSFSRLLRKSDKKMCCLGFFSKQILKLPDSDILEVLHLCKREGVIKPSQNDKKGFKKILDINDSDNISDKDREILLKKEFNRMGYEVEFK